jgi:hypothetical protein
MTQVHRRFTVEQVKILCQGYCQGNLNRSDVEEMLGIGKARFFALLKTGERSSTKHSFLVLIRVRSYLNFECQFRPGSRPNIEAGARLPKWRLLQGGARDHRIMWSYPLHIIYLQFGYFVASFLLLLLMAFVVVPYLQA